MAHTVTLRRDGRVIFVHPPPGLVNEVCSRVAQGLRFYERRHLQGMERRQARAQGRPLVEMVPYDLYEVDGRGVLCFAPGFYDRVRSLLLTAGFDVTVVDDSPHPAPEVYEPVWENVLAAGTLLPGQDEALLIFCGYDRGCIDCYTGWGKSYVLKMACRMWPRAKIDIISRDVSVVLDTLYPDIASDIPDVGVVGGGRKIKDRRVMLYTVGSLHHSPGDADVVFFDEVHQACTDEAVQKLARYGRARMFGLSASLGMRLDGRDFLAEQVFGPTRLKVEMREGVEASRVVPVVVQLRPVVLDYDPVFGVDDPVSKKRLGLWTNDVRNDLIAQDAASYSAEVQVMVSCDTLEHACHLKARLPDFTLVTREFALEERRPGERFTPREEYGRKGLIDSEAEPVMTYERRRALTQAFSTGKLKKAITTVWRAGVNFRQLSVLVRAGGGSSRVADVQLPGRIVRTAAGKECAILHDYLDFFNSGLLQSSRGRQRSYERLGFSVVVTDK